jgi:RHS repeat-associated protein
VHESVVYFHAGGIDRPLMISKGAERVVPHQNWRGAFSAGTYGSGLRVGQKSDCPPGVVMDCIKIDWPGWATTAWHQKTNTDIQTWYGSLVNGMRDASGQLYMRNRYYDPATGQFTQTDPIGLAGGLNAYGFAAGDPVTYSDPYGLKVCYQGSRAEVNALRGATEQATGAAVFLDRNNCVSAVGNSMNSGLRGLRNRLTALASSDDVYNVSFGKRGDETEAEVLSGQGWVQQSYTGGRPDCRGAVCPYSVQIGSGWADRYRSTQIFGLCMPWGSTPNDLAQVVAHELLGHGWEFHVYGVRGAFERTELQNIRASDNVYLRAASNKPPRCGH